MNFDLNAAIEAAARDLERQKSEEERRKDLTQQKRELLQGVRELRRMSGQLKSALELAAKTETDSCALFAARECWRRFKENFPCGVLRFEYPSGHKFAGEGHAVCVYQLPEQTMMVYEPGSGSANVGRVGWDASAVAKGFCKGAMHAKWIARP